MVWYADEHKKITLLIVIRSKIFSHYRQGLFEKTDTNINSSTRLKKINAPCAKKTVKLTVYLQFT